ncbi:Hypothetical predicted protein [Paramuricea clavata]|uniref:Uncharacterized protein n=1 Tax=Paramuricea clavata TaxID=317549 RepID=A0A6S7GE68_PARCT|nr:Hypothetical predicted protein [Paramuricea clavata]
MKKVLSSKNRTTKIDKLVVEGVDIVYPKDISDSLNLHFISVATNLLSARSPTTMSSTSNPDSHHVPPSQFPSSLESSLPNKFHFRPTTDVEISNMLANLNPNKATGNDNIPAKILKISSNCISQSLSCIVNTPISILPCLSKICESCVKNQMNEHDQEFQTFFEPSQYAQQDVLSPFADHSKVRTNIVLTNASLEATASEKKLRIYSEKIIQETNNSMDDVSI